MTLTVCVLSTDTRNDFSFNQIKDYAYINLKNKPVLSDRILLSLKSKTNSEIEFQAFIIKGIICPSIYKTIDFPKSLPFLNKKFDFYIIIDEIDPNLKLFSELNEDGI